LPLTFAMRFVSSESVSIDQRGHMPLTLGSLFPSGSLEPGLKSLLPAEQPGERETG